MEYIDTVVNKINDLLTNEVKIINGVTSFGTLIEAFNILDDDFNHAFSSGFGAKFDSNNNLIEVDGFGLFKYLNYETHPILEIDDTWYTLKLKGELMYDRYEISILKTHKIKNEEK